MRTIRVNFKATSKDLKIENPIDKGVLLDPNLRVMSIGVETENSVIKYLIPIESINYVEDIAETQRVQLVPGGMIPKVS